MSIAWLVFAKFSSVTDPIEGYVGAIDAAVRAACAYTRWITPKVEPFNSQSTFPELPANRTYRGHVRIVRGRDASYLAPPAQIRTGPIRAYGSRLGCLTAKRAAGQGWRMRDAGSQSSTSFFIRSKVVESLSLRRVSERRHRL